MERNGLRVESQFIIFLFLILENIKNTFNSLKFLNPNIVVLHRKYIFYIVDSVCFIYHCDRNLNFNIAHIVMHFSLFSRIDNFYIQKTTLALFAFAVLHLVLVKFWGQKQVHIIEITISNGFCTLYQINVVITFSLLF